MEDTVKIEIALEVGKILEEHNGMNIKVLDISKISSWTDLFVIATITSNAHMKGLIRHVKEYLDDREIKILHNRKSAAEDGWELIDCGFFVIHLMNSEMRDFYDLERLWFAGVSLSHSSKSS